MTRRSPIRLAISGTSAKEEDWTLDALGNWTGYVQKTNGSTDLNQARTFNAANETTQIDSSTTHVAHDAAGNMTKLPKPSSWSAHYDLVFDAWNRLVSVSDNDTGKSPFLDRTGGQCTGRPKHSWNPCGCRT